MRPHPQKQTLKSTVKGIVPILFIIAVLLTFSGLGPMLLWMLYNIIATGGWRGLSIEYRQPQTTHTLVSGEQTFEIVLADYTVGQDYVPVNVYLSVQDNTPGATAYQFRAIASTYDDNWRAIGEQEAAYYKRKDVDGDWKKDFLLRAGNGLSEAYYYVSSRDGRGFKTDKNFKNAQPLSSEEREPF